MALRAFNLILSLMAALMLSFPLLIVSILVRVTSNGPVIHWSKRIGKDNKIFLMPKFRTMTIEAPQLATHLLAASGKNYLTPIGSFLRKSSLDELPQLWSVINGDMNLVGPRPALFNQDDLINLRTQLNVHLVAPGVTGWAQVNGRDELPIPLKVKLDKEYVDKRSFLFDLRILFLTIVKVLKRSNIQH